MLNKYQIVNWLLDCEHIFTEQRDYLTALDTDIGDGDHGLNMQRGFTKVAEKLPAVADKDIGQVLKTTGMTLLSSVGGASGPLYGIFFIRAAATGNDPLHPVAQHLAELAEGQALAGIAAGRRPDEEGAVEGSAGAADRGAGQGGGCRRSWHRGHHPDAGPQEARQLSW